MLPFLVHFRHIPEALDNFKPDIIAYNAGESSTMNNLRGKTLF